MANIKKRPSTWRGGRRRGRRVYRRRNVRTTTSMIKRPFVRADKLIVRMPWETTKVFATSTTVGSTTFQRFRLNSIWDPDYSSAAGQNSAMGFGLYNGIYNKYRVFGATVQLTLDNGTAGVSVPGAIAPNNYAFQGSDQLDLVATQPHSTRFLLGNGAGSGSRYKFKRYYKMPHLFGQTSVQYKTDADKVGGLVSSPSDPIDDMILTLAFGSTPSAAGVTLQIRIIYHVELFDPTPLAETLRIQDVNPETV